MRRLEMCICAMVQVQLLTWSRGGLRTGTRWSPWLGIGAISLGVGEDMGAGCCEGTAANCGVLTFKCFEIVSNVFSCRVRMKGTGVPR